MIDVESGDVGASTDGSVPEARNKNGSIDGAMMEVNPVNPAAAAAVSTKQPRDSGNRKTSIFDEEEYEGASEPRNQSEVLSDNPFHGRAVTEGTPGKIVRVVGPPTSIQRPLKGTFVGDGQTRRRESSSQRIKNKQDNARNRSRSRSRSRSGSPAEPPNERPEDLELDVSRISERTEGSDGL
jgi:hypothetical protein